MPMTVLRRLDAVLEPTKQAVIEMKQKLDAANISTPYPHMRLLMPREDVYPIVTKPVPTTTKTVSESLALNKDSH